MTLFGRWDHPRMCGEKTTGAAPVGGFRGSPPHVRGKVVSVGPNNIKKGDHPRMCGEKAVASILWYS